MPVGDGSDEQDASAPAPRSVPRRTGPDASPDPRRTTPPRAARTGAPAGPTRGGRVVRPTAAGSSGAGRDATSDLPADDDPAGIPGWLTQALNTPYRDHTTDVAPSRRAEPLDPTGGSAVPRSTSPTGMAPTSWPPDAASPTIDAASPTADTGSVTSMPLDAGRVTSMPLDATSFTHDAASFAAMPSRASTFTGMGTERLPLTGSESFVTTAIPVVESVGAPTGLYEGQVVRTTVATRSRRPRVRKVRRVIRSIDAWSVFKVSLIFYALAYVIVLVAGVLLWNLAISTGTIGNVEGLVRELFGLDKFTLDGAQIYRASWALGAFMAIGGTGLNVVAAVLFNLITDLVGGVRVTVLEEEVRVDGPRRRFWRRSRSDSVDGGGARSGNVSPP